MADHINLNVYRRSAAARRLSPRNHPTALALLALGLGFVAFRTRRLRPLASALAVLGMARSAAGLFRHRQRDAREKRLDKTVEESFPASDAPALP